jgi:hypothetical protein
MFKTLIKLYLDLLFFICFGTDELSPHSGLKLNFGDGMAPEDNSKISKCYILPKSVLGAL